MGFRTILFLIAVLLNGIVYLAMRRAIIAFLDSRLKRLMLMAVPAAILLLNLPILLLFSRRPGGLLYLFSPETLRELFFPTSVWIATLMIFLMLVVPVFIVALLIKGIGRLFGKTLKPAAPLSDSQTSLSEAASPAIHGVLSRRNFLAGSAGLLVPGIFAVEGYKAFGSMDEIGISPERAIPMPHLPATLEGLRIVQISDLHAGPFTGERVLRHVVKLINGLGPDLVFITGDTIDRSLSNLPEALRGLQNIHSPLGTYAILGNHDISSDPYGRSGDLWGGNNIVQGLASIGIKTLRNEAIYLGSERSRLALLGLDWLSKPGDSRFYSYRQLETRSQLRRMMEQVDPETPTILLAHHPDTFIDAAPLGIGMTLSGHTHGGGQVVLANVNGVPLGIGILRSRYLNGLYEEQGSSLYVNRGIGYFGIPIRINCSPEISRFKLVMSNNGTKGQKSGAS